MKEFDERTYGDRIAAIYDEMYPGYEEATIDLLEEFARGGRALELWALAPAAWPCPSVAAAWTSPASTLRNACSAGCRPSRGVTSCSWCRVASIPWISKVASS